jgi:hypothetical protein
MGGATTAKNLTLLCPNHHAQHHRSQSGIAFIQRHNATPFNAAKATTSLMFRPVESLMHRFGSTVVQTAAKEGAHVHIKVIWIDGYDMLALRIIDSIPFIHSMTVTDENGNVLLGINDGEIRFWTNSTDIKMEGDKIRVWVGKKMVLDMSLSTSGINLRKGCFAVRKLGHPTPVGLKVVDGDIVFFKGPESSGVIRNSTFVECGSGAIGIHDTEQYPGARPDVGFGYFLTL